MLDKATALPARCGGRRSRSAMSTRIRDGWIRSLTTDTRGTYYFQSINRPPDGGLFERSFVDDSAEIERWHQSITRFCSLHLERFGTQSGGLSIQTLDSFRAIAFSIVSNLCSIEPTRRRSVPK